MIKQLRTLLNSLSSAKEPDTHQGIHDKQIAAATLMVEAACLDGDFDLNERKKIRDLMSEKFALEEKDAELILSEAEKEQSKSSQLLNYSRLIKDSYSLEERNSIIEWLWEVVYADGVVHEYEANLLRRISGLLYVSDRDSGKARKRVVRRLGIDEDLVYEKFKH